MNITKLYGTGDDTLRIEGYNGTDEYPGSEKPKYLAFSDGTIAMIYYDARAVWSIDIAQKGKGKIKKLYGLPDDADEKQKHRDKNAPSFSDILIIRTEKSISLTYVGLEYPNTDHSLEENVKARAVIEYLKQQSISFKDHWNDSEDDIRNEWVEKIAKIIERKTG